jgi:hypothetical protein
MVDEQVSCGQYFSASGGAFYDIPGLFAGGSQWLFHEYVPARI